MGIPKLAPLANLEDYFSYLEQSEFKSEFHDGAIVDMEGGSPEHALIVGNLMGIIGAGIKGNGCKLYSPDLLVGAEHSNSYFLPDITCICGAMERSGLNRNVLINPTLIIEVLSPSTWDIDRTSKLLRYLQIPSLRDYVLVEQDKALVDICYMDKEGHWQPERVEGLEGKVTLRSLGIEIPMSEIYDGVEMGG